MMKVYPLEVKSYLVVPTEKTTLYSIIRGGYDDMLKIFISGTLSETKREVDNFLRYAKQRPASSFWIVHSFIPIEDLAPMFELAPSNCIFPSIWRPYNSHSPERKYW